MLHRDERNAAHSVKPLTYYSDAQRTPEWYVRRKIMCTRFMPNGKQLVLPAIGGSSVAKYMLSPYQDGDPSELYAVARGDKDAPDVENVYTKYGERYEPRARAIFETITGRYDRQTGVFQHTLSVEETGMYRWRDRTNVGVSLDGITRESVRLRGCTDDGPLGTVYFDWHLGQALVEIKTSMQLKPAPLVSYILQTQLQLLVRGRLYAFLVYWSADAVRIWLIRRDEALCRWMLRRIDLASMHVCRGVPLSEHSPFLPWRRCGGDRFYSGITWADYVQWQWFGTSTTMKSDADKPRKPPNNEHRPPLGREYWVEELKRLRITSGRRPAPTAAAATVSASLPPSQLQPQRPAVDLENDELYWSDDVPGGAETDINEGDADEPYLPNCPPDIYLVYEYKRTVPPDEVDTNVILDPLVKNGDCYLKDHDPADKPWFAQRFPSIPGYSRHYLSKPLLDIQDGVDEDGLPCYSLLNDDIIDRNGPGGHGNIKRLFITSIEAEPLPAAVLTERIGTSQTDDSPAERADFELRVQQQRVEMQQKAALSPLNATLPVVSASATTPRKRSAASLAASKKRPDKSAVRAGSIDVFLKHMPRGAVFKRE